MNNNSFNEQQGENNARGGARSQGPDVSCRITRSDEGEGVVAWRGVAWRGVAWRGAGCLLERTRLAGKHRRLDNVQAESIGRQSSSKHKLQRQ